MTNQELIDDLNEAIELEVQAFLQYHYQSLLLKGLSTGTLKAMLEKESAKEAEHAKKLAARVVALGGRPATQIRSFEIGAGPDEMVRLNIAREERAVALYRKIVGSLRHKEGFELVYYEVLTILGDELEDLEEFRALLD